MQSPGGAIEHSSASALSLSVYNAISDACGHSVRVFCLNIGRLVLMKRVVGVARVRVASFTRQDVRAAQRPMHPSSPRRTALECSLSTLP